MISWRVNPQVQSGLILLTHSLIGLYLSCKAISELCSSFSFSCYRANPTRDRLRKWWWVIPLILILLASEAIRVWPAFQGDPVGVGPPGSEQESSDPNLSGSRPVICTTTVGPGPVTTLATVTTKGVNTNEPVQDKGQVTLPKSGQPPLQCPKCPPRSRCGLRWPRILCRPGPSPSCHCHRKRCHHP